MAAIYEKAAGSLASLERMTARRYGVLSAALESQRRDVEAYLAQRQERMTPRLAARLSEIGEADAAEVGGKAASLGEVRNRLRIRVPDGYALTTEAYRQFFGVPHWKRVRDALRDLDPSDLDALKAVSGELTALVLESPLPRAVEVALTERGRMLSLHGAVGLAVRSSAAGEGGPQSFAGQFQSCINVRLEGLPDAYRQVVASRFSERAVSYRLSRGLAEVDTPMAVLVLPTIPARSSGILYTRDPRDAKSPNLVVNATWGLGLDIAGGHVPADLFVVSRDRPHRVVEQKVAAKPYEISLAPGGGLLREPIPAARGAEPSLDAGTLTALAEAGMQIEGHFGAPQDIEWAVDEAGEIVVLQARPLTLARPGARGAARVREQACLAGGRPVYPGRVSGPAFLVDEPEKLPLTPEGAILFLRRASPDIVKVFPRIAGLVSEWGNIAGHAAALLREFRVPSVFEMTGAFDHLVSGELVSLDAAQGKVYSGVLWVAPVREEAPELAAHDPTPINRRLLTLTLLDPSALNFRPRGCRSTHDVLRFCHETAIEEMFALNDRALLHGSGRSKRLRTSAPVNIHVLDLGGGVAPEAGDATDVTAEQVRSRPFHALWRGVTHPDATWNREMPATLSGLASVIAGSLAATVSGAGRALGEKSYLVVTRDYMNLNSRLAYHFTLVDASVSDTPGQSYIAFRFAGGAATRRRRHLRARFIEACLAHYGFQAERRGDIVNAWFKKAPAAETEDRLDILGRLLASASQLDMYMTGDQAMRWYVEQFLAGNYAFAQPPEKVTS